LDIGLKASEYILKSEDPKIIAKNGVFVIEYTIEENKKKVTEYKQNEEDEI
jgi:hypothetical protein